MSAPLSPFPEVLDSSLLTAWRSCQEKARLEYFLHYKPHSQSVHLLAGGAFARGLEVARKSYWEDGLTPVESVGEGLLALTKHYGDFECPADSAKSLTRMMGALEYYFDYYPLDNDPAPPSILPSGKRAIEFSFLEPISIRHPETGNPILFSGRFDEVVDFCGSRYGEDDKTTSSLGATWSKQWDLRSQFTAYTWGAERAGFPIAGFLIRGVSILKTKYETQQALTYRPTWQVERWYKQTLIDVKAMIRAWESGQWNFNLDESCNSYGGCLFKPICLARDPAPWLESNYSRRRWNPVTREEEELA